MLDQLQEQREHLQTQSRTGHNAWSGLIFKNEGGFGKYAIGGGPCHGHFSSYSMEHTHLPKLKSTDELVALWSRMMPLHVKDEYAKEFYEWLFNESFWADMFLTKSFEDVKKFGHLVRVDLPNDLVISGFIASRFLTENYSGDWKERTKTYTALRDVGVSVPDAFFFFHLLAPSGKGFMLSRLSSGHAVFNFHDADSFYYKSALNNRGTATGRNFYVSQSSCGYTEGVYRLWRDKSGHEGGHEKTFARLEGVRPRTLIKGVDLNIFRKIVKEKNVILQKDLLDVVEQMKEIINA